MARSLEHLGSFSDWVAFAKRYERRYPPQPIGGLTTMEAREILGLVDDGTPIDPQIERTWQCDGVAGEEVSWSVGYGPRTRAWLLRPLSATGPLPGVLAFHCHGAFKFLGKEKIADGPDGPDPLIGDMRRDGYGGRAFANELARRGFTVLVPDVFLWGSRRFELPVLLKTVSGEFQQLAPELLARTLQEETVLREQTVPSLDYVELYNRAAMLHEHIVSKYCALLGSSLAGIVAFEDRIALKYLRSRVDVFEGGIGCIGCSGGGCRAALLRATSSDIDAAVIVCMMSTYSHMLDHNVSCHTWMLFPPGLAKCCDWPDLVAGRAPAPLMVQYAKGDALFPLDGMIAAHERISTQYEVEGMPQAYVGEFYEGPHRFDATMQDAAFRQLETWLTP